MVAVFGFVQLLLSSTLHHLNALHVLPIVPLAFLLLNVFSVFLVFWLMVLASWIVQWDTIIITLFVLPVCMDASSVMALIHAPNAISEFYTKDYVLNYAPLVGLSLSLHKEGNARDV